jgi:hypothetical protein
MSGHNAGNQTGNHISSKANVFLDTNCETSTFLLLENNRFESL